MMRDIDKDTVDFVPNYDGEEQEPTVLPAAVPNLLINGSSGIAVGMATNIPPHNMCEVVDALNALIDNPDLEIEQLMHYIKGPDFPTAGLILGQQGIKDAYLTGRGTIKMRAKTHVEVTAKGKQRIVVTELPYQVNKARLIERMANLVRDKVIEGITEIRDESSGAGIRVVIELKNDAIAKVVLNRLYKHTQMQDTFGAIMIALVDNEPRVLNLKEILQCYVKHQQEIVERRCRFDLAKAQERAHILEGLKIALDYIDEVVATIRNAANPEEARTKLMERFGLSFKQAAAILEMRLYKLIGLEILALEKEYKECLKKIAQYEKILGSRRAMDKVIKEDLEQIKAEFALPRRTRIEDGGEIVYVEAPEKAQELVFVMDRFGYCKNLDNGLYEKNRDSVDNEYRFVLRCMSDDRVCIFTDRGNLHQVKMQDIPTGKLKDKGVPVDNISKFDGSREEILYLTRASALAGENFLFATRQAQVKLVPGEEFVTNNRTVASTKLAEEDALVCVKPAGGEPEVVLQTSGDMFLRFATEEIPVMKKNSRGVRGMKLAEGEFLEQVYYVQQEPVIRYKEKEVHLNRMKTAKRDGKGSKIRV